MATKIKLLSATTINRIAAGEVIERPASVVKELVENSIDAGATKIEVTLEAGGRNLIIVVDDGAGMGPDDLNMCILKHATSKIDDTDIFDIRFLGFRGEAIPSIGSVSRMRISSKPRMNDANLVKFASPELWPMENLEKFSGADDKVSSSRPFAGTADSSLSSGNAIDIEAGTASEIMPASLDSGTKIEVRDLFFATPVRLKFLKSERTELLYAEEILRNLAIANPNIRFVLKNGSKLVFDYKVHNNIEDTLLGRIGDILGKDFIKNSVKIEAKANDATIIAEVSGYACLPTFNRGNATSQYLFVNNRPVKDKVILGAVKAAYQDYLPKDRYPFIVLFLTLSPNLIDVNVHPTKREVRFVDSNLIRGLVIKGINNGLATASNRASSTIADQTLAAFKGRENIVSNIRSFGRPNFESVKQNYAHILPGQNIDDDNSATQNSTGANLIDNDLLYGNRNAGQLNPGHLADKASAGDNLYRFTAAALESQQVITDAANIANAKNDSAQAASQNPAAMLFNQRSMRDYSEQIAANNVDNSQVNTDFPLGMARCQLHGTYIVAQNADGIVLVDQHAAHERLLYEKIKQSLSKQNVLSQQLLIPDIIELDQESVLNLAAKADELAEFGLVIEKFGETAIMVRQIPAILGEVDSEGLIKQLAEDLLNFEDNTTLKDRLAEVSATFACHSSIRAGKTLTIQEMNQILRQMEATPYSGQCNHGRPTYVELKLKDVEKLFGRR